MEREALVAGAHAHEPVEDAPLGVHLEPRSAMTSMGKQRELRPQWQRACKLILAKADVMTVSRALELALFMDAKLDVSKVPAR